MRLLQQIKDKRQKGFTIVELLVIAPIVILTIGAFVTVIVNMTGDVLAARTSTLLAYNVQNALNKINADVNLSSTFLAQTNLTEGVTTSIPLITPQGYSDDNGSLVPFNNVDPTYGNMLVLNTLTTTANPLDKSAAYVYLSGLPNSCTSNQVNQNTPMTYNIVYFIKNNTLWRRVILPSNYTTAGCNVPWQQPSCNPTYIAGHPGLAICQTQDQDLIDNISTSGFSIQYFNTASSVTPDSVSSDTGSTVPQRNAALKSLATVGVSITVNATAAGRAISQSGTIRSTRLGTSASSIAAVSPATTPGTPVPSGSFTAAPPAATITWPSVSGGGVMTYTVDYSLNGGTSWTNGFTGLSQTSYTYNASSQNQTITFRVSANNGPGSTSLYGQTSVVIPLWATPVLQNGWVNFGGNGYSGTPYNTAAYTRTSSGLVALKGLVASGSGTIFTLPAGYRPTEQLVFLTVAGSDTTAGRVDILPDGTVSLQVGGSGYVSLSSIRFMPASPIGPTFTNFTPLNSWVYFGGAYAQPAYAVDSAGRVQLKGLVKSGTTTSPTALWNFVTTPSNLTPAETSIIPESSNNSIGAMEPSLAVSAVAFYSGSNAFLSIQGMYYPSGAATWTSLTLQNSWVWFGGNPATPAVTKGSDGIVMLKGLIKSGTIANGTLIANLPAGFRPQQEIVANGVSNNIFGRFDIWPNGNIVSVSVNNNAWLTLDGISFPAEQ